MFAQLWSKEHIEKIDVIALESISIEGRAAFYEQTGALRDIVQGHLLQLLALTILPLPEDDTFSWDSLPDRRLEALQWLQPADPSRSVHAQYDTYREEVGNPDSNVETFVSTLLESNDPNWKGVPMSLTTGKGLDKKKTEIRIHFRRMNMSQSNFLTFKLYPDEGIKIDLVTRKPGYDQEIENRSLSFSYATEARMPDAYEQVLVDAIKSRKSLFTCSGEVLRAWEIVAPLQKTWARQTDIQKYSMGSRARAVIGDLPTDELA
jgi:glucose-6-phosphate 1-dehydrogenase